MKIFKCCTKEGAAAIAVAFNRGHAVKILSKVFETHGLAFSKEDAVVEISTETKGAVHILHDGRPEQTLDETASS